MIITIPTILGILGLVLGWPTSTHAGGVQYQARGNVEVQEGTLEVWFTPVADLYPKLEEREYRSVFQLFSLSVPGHFSFNAHWYGWGKVHRLHVSMSQAKIRDGLIPIPARPLDWKPNERHHVALTWSGHEMLLWADGSQVGHRSQAASFEGPLSDATLVVGNAQFQDSPIIVHAVRVSDVARKETELKSTAPLPDIHTLLLDRFDSTNSIASDARTKPLVISDLTDCHCGEIKGSHHFVKGAESGLALFAEKESHTP